MTLRPLPRPRPPPSTAACPSTKQLPRNVCQIVTRLLFAARQVADIDVCKSFLWYLSAVHTHVGGPCLPSRSCYKPTRLWHLQKCDLSLSGLIQYTVIFGKFAKKYPNFFFFSSSFYLIVFCPLGNQMMYVTFSSITCFSSIPLCISSSPPSHHLYLTISISPYPSLYIHPSPSLNVG